MASGMTNKGKYNLLGYGYRNGTRPTNYYVRLITSAVVPTVDTNTASELTQIAAGNGYTAGGAALTPGATDFDVLTEDDVNDRALVQVKDIVWTAAGGPIPASGSGASYAVLTDDNATDGSREIHTYWDLVSARTVSDTQTLTLQDLEIRLTE
jgi:hypothetical protein